MQVVQQQPQFQLVAVQRPVTTTTLTTAGGGAATTAFQQTGTTATTTATAGQTVNVRLASGQVVALPLSALSSLG